MLIAIIISYFLGSIPTAYLFGRAKGIDIREHGSGNIGATNALRVLGKGAGITVLFLDILKGVIAVIILGDLAVNSLPEFSPEIVRILIAISCICGHNWTVFLSFKGGKGIATTLGVLIGLAAKVPGLGLILVFLILTWFIIFLISRIVSLSSIIATLVFPVLTIIFGQSRVIITASVILCVFSLLRHKSNLVRILQGKEPRLSFKKTV
ncbi:MAG: glycerol-3-phosphate 1-O-acyltransferase PlsY [Candidatus Omnitrophota bacterium]